MLSMTVTAEMVERAQEKLRQGAPYSVAAILVGETTPPDLDGARWVALVCDGRTHGLIDVELSGSNGGRRGMQVDPAFIEGEVEWRAGHFPRECRLVLLLASKTVVIPEDRLPLAA
jgi:hypothetical protein